MNTILFAMDNDRNMTEPMNLMLLSALAKSQGRQFRTELTVLEKEPIADALKRVKPSIVAFSAIMGSHQIYLQANADVKKIAPSIKTAIGGPYATFNPQVVGDRVFDAVGIGECDDAWPELLDAWSAGRSADDIPNIITPSNVNRLLRRSLTDEHGYMIASEHLRPRKTNLDDLPYMDRDLVYQNTAFKNRMKRTIMASRGCPHRCTYCFEHAWNSMYQGKGKILQRYSVKRLCAEMKEVVSRYETHFWKFYDDVFPVFDGTDDEWLEEFAEVYPREIGIPFHCLVRAEQVDEKSARKLTLLKKAGIASITMSIEAGNAFSRDYVLIRDMTEKEMRNSFAICRRLGIHTFANTILGVPNPILPNVRAPAREYEQELSRVLSIASEVDPKRSRPYKKLADKVEEARASAPSEQDRRFAVDCVLREAGVRAKPIEYDLDSVLFNISVQASFGEYPMFFPYQGTQLGNYAVRHGFFDGNYDKLHASYQTKSPLGFTEKEKLQQQNLAVLGTILHLFSGSFNPIMNMLAKPATWLVVNVLADLPLTHLYVPVYSAVKDYMHQTRVYPMGNAGFAQRVRFFWENLVLDIFKQKGKSNVRVGQTLGGSAAP